MTDRLARAEWRADCLKARADTMARGDGEPVDIERIAKRLMPGASSAEIAKAVSYAKPKMTRDGRPGEVDALAYVKEHLGEERTRKRFGDDALADANPLKSGINNRNSPYVFNGMNAAQRLAKAQSDEYNRQIKNGKSPKEANEAANAITVADAEDPCWDGYEQAGTKEKGGVTVPNCVEADATTDAVGDLKFGPKSKMLFAQADIRKFEAEARKRGIDPHTKEARKIPGYENWSSAQLFVSGQSSFYNPKY